MKTNKTKEIKPVLGYQAVELFRNPSAAQVKTITTTGGGGAAVDTSQVGAHVSYLRNLFPEVLQSRIVSGVNYTKFPRIASKLGVEWLAEGGQSTPSSVTIQAVPHVYKTLRTDILKVSREWLEDSGEVGAMMIDEIIGTALVDEVLRVVLYGDASAGEPVGLVNTSGVESVTVAGLLADYDPILQAAYKVVGNRVPFENVSAIMPVNAAYQLATLRDLENRYLAPPPQFAAIPAVTTTAVTENGTTRIFVGDFSQVVIGIDGPVRLNLVERYADEWSVAFVAAVRMDVSFLRPDNFCIVNAVNVLPIT